MKQYMVVDIYGTTEGMSKQLNDYLSKGWQVVGTLQERRVILRNFDDAGHVRQEPAK